MKFLHFIGELAIKLENSDPSYLEDKKIIRVSTPWKLVNNKFLQFLCHFHLSSNINSKCPLPFRKIWNKRIFKNRFIVDDEPVCVIFGSHFYEMMNTGAIEYIKKNYPNSSVVLMFSDKYDYFRKNYKRFPTVEELKKRFDLVCTYNVGDAEKYGFYLYRQALKDYSFVENDETIPRSDLFFVGKNKGRIDLLHSIYENCTKAGLYCDFYITDVDDDNIKYPNKIKYNQYIDYNEVLKHSKRTNCILNIIQENGDGVTMRDYEALGLNKLLLTNSEYIKKTEFYNRDQIIMLDELENRFNDIKKGCLIKNNYLENYNRIKQYKDIEKMIKEKRESCL